MFCKTFLIFPRWAKLFLTALCVFLILCLLGALTLQTWAKEQTESGTIQIKEIEATHTPTRYTARLYFARLDFLLRSQSIANIHIQNIAWDKKINSDSIQNITARNRNVDFTTPQKLTPQQFLGTAQYTMDFRPFVFTILKFGLFVFFAFCALVILLNNNAFRAFVVQHCTQQNIATTLWNGYCRIPLVNRRTFWIVFWVTQLVFGFHTVQFLWGNHDWGAVYQYYGLLGDTGLGRYTEIFITLGLQNGMVLPFLNNILAFLSLSLCAVLLCAFLRVPQKLWIWTTVALFLTLQPFVFSRLYYAYQAGGLFLAVAIGIFGFVLAQKANAYKTGGGKPLLFVLCAVLCFHWAFAAYQVFVDTAAVLLLGGIIVFLLDKKTSLRAAIFEFRFSFFALFLGALSYKIVLDFLKWNGAASAGYQTTMLPWNQWPERFLTTVHIAFKALFHYDFPFFPPSTTLFFGVLFLAFVVLLCFCTHNKMNKINMLIVLIWMVIASQTHTLLSNSITFGPRIDFYGLLFLRVLLVVLIFKISEQFVAKRFAIQNLLFVFSALILWVFVVQDLFAQRLQKQALDFELKLLNRVIARIENHSNFSYGKNYCGVIFGEVPNLRKRLYPNAQGKDFSIAADLLDHRLITEWDPKAAFSYNMPENIFNRCRTFLTDGNLHNPRLQKILARLHSAGLLQTLEPWPGKNSVVVFEDIIVFVASGENLEKAKEIFQNPR